MTDKLPRNSLPPLREPDSPIPENIVDYVEDMIEMATVATFEEYYITDTPLNFNDFIKENQEGIYEAFSKADDLLLSELGKIIRPLAESYANEVHLLNFEDEEESEG